MRVVTCDNTGSSRRESALTSCLTRVSGLTSAATAECLQFLMLRRSVNDERREKLFEDVAVLFEQQTEELLDVMAHDVHFEPFNHARVFHRFIMHIQPDDL